MLIVQHFGSSDGGFGSLAEVARLFANPALLLAGWLHYLAFDLFIGAWEVRDAQRHGFPHLLVIPCLLLTFLLGPIGLLCYMAVRVRLGRRGGRRHRLSAALRTTAHASPTHRARQALQALPLLGFLLDRRHTAPALRTRTLSAVAVAWFAAMAVTLVLALRGRALMPW